jgi:flagellar protein FliO/FliZ
MDFDSLLRLALALGFVLGLIVLAAFVMRRLGLAGPVVLKPGQERRLHLVEARAVDARRQLLLVRRDGVEHLLLLSPNGETVIETGIPAKSERP